MPASLFSEMERNGMPFEGQRLYDLALEMSMIDLHNGNESLSNSYDGEPRSKKSQNTTECVPVPSSEHVAEIVGRQGCKIKALRAKTNTYIKTPVRGEEPVFVVTGRKEDVNSAKREILSAAEHFSQIRAQRKNNLNGTLIPGPNSNIPGQTTIQVRVPYRVVGLVVGPKGATIKRIQQQTNTYIVTPSRDKEPIFEVTGLPDNVESARKEIEAHIAMRTGGSVDAVDDDFNSNALESLTNNLNAINSSLFKTDMGNGFICPFPRDSNNLLDLHPGDNIFNFSTSTGRNSKQNDMFNNIFGFSSNFGLYDVDEGLGDSPTFEAPGASLSASSWPDFGTSTLTDSGISLFGSTSISGSSTGLSDLSQRSNSISGALTDLIVGDHPPARRIRSDPLTVPEVGDILCNLGSTISMSSFSPLASTSPVTLASGFPAAATKCTSSSSSSPIESLAPGNKSKRECVMCYESAIVAALVPCGHNLFCMECANRICEKSGSECPECHTPASQAIRIYS
ncbi:RNA-binding protein MEX3B, partial [Stegodyphus mimosarum]